MKTILLTVALAGLTFGSYAQNRTCNCKSKTVHDKVAAKKAPLQAAKPALAQKTDDVYKVQEEPCYTYDQHGIVVTECPSEFYDNAVPVAFIEEDTYMGYYPKDNKPATNSVCTDQRVAPGKMTQQHTQIIEQCDGKPLPDPYFCIWNCPAK